MQELINWLKEALDKLFGGQLTLSNTFITGQVNCAIKNTPYQFPGYTVPWNGNVTVKALPENVGLVYISYDATVATQSTQAYPLAPNEGIPVPVRNTKAIYMSSTVDGEGAAFILGKAERG